MKRIKVKIKYDDKYLSKIIFVQKCVRRWLVIRNNCKMKDYVTHNIVSILLEKYNENMVFNKKMNELLLVKKIRNENFPSVISENIAKFAIFRHYRIMGTWDTNKGDLLLLNKRLEVKGFSSDGPSSFGPSEKWDMLYFVDSKRHIEKYFVVYEISLSNDDPRWKMIKVNKNQTFYQQCLEKRRPRIIFKDIQSQIPPQYLRKIFEGQFCDLCPK